MRAGVFLFAVLVSLALGDHVDPLSDHVCELMDEDVQDALREDLLKHNCMKEVELVDPSDPQRAARLFHRDGFVVVKDVLKQEQINSVKARCTNIAEEILEKDPRRLGNRGPLRYSFGPPHKTGHIIHYPEIAQLIDVPELNDALRAIFGNDRYIVRGSRGDFNLPGAPYQVMHNDVGRDWLFDPATSEFPDTGRIDVRDLPLFHVVASFVLSDLNAINAPIRQIPMTQNSHRFMPWLDDEPLWMKRSTLCPVPAGSIIFRDPRAWHGGTPNLSEGIRLLPNLEYYAYWYRYKEGKGANQSINQMRRSLPREVYDTLSPEGQHRAREIVALPGEEIDTSMQDDSTLIWHDVIDCYRKMGVTNEEIEEAKRNGLYYAEKEGAPRRDFYGRRKNQQTNAVKDEL